MGITLCEDTAQKQKATPTQTRQPNPWHATGWICVFALLHLVGVFLYIVGYGGYVEGKLDAQGEIIDPGAIKGVVEAHMQTPAAIVGMYMTQFCLILPVLLLVANFKEQSCWNTLGLHSFAFKSLWLWVALLLVFLVMQMFVMRLLQIEQSEFMQMLVGTRHLLLALVAVLAAPLLEELMFRGYLFRAWRRTRLGLSGTLLLTSSLFTLLHWGQYHWVQQASIFVFALILGLAREKGGSVLLPMLLHALNNLGAVIVVIYLGIL